MKISLTFLFRLAAFIPLLVGAAAAGLIWGPDLWNYLARARASTGSELRAEQRMIVYRLQARSPATFTFSKPTTLFRIVSSPAIAPAEKPRPEGWVYGYRVRMIGADGGEIGRQDVFSNSVLFPRKPEFAPPQRFFRARNERVAMRDGAILSADDPVASIELVPLGYDPGVVGIDVRVYERRPFIASTALAAFRRRSPQEQEQLAIADTFSPALLSDEEKANISLNQWRPVGPIGISGRDYQVLVMYGGSVAGDGEEEAQ